MALPNEIGVEMKKTNFNFYITGMGLVNAAMNLSLILSDSTIHLDRVLNIGWAGSFEIPKGELVEVNEVVHRSLNSFIKSPTLKLDCMSPIKKVICGSADFVESKNESFFLVKRDKVNFQVMDMELFALASVCKKKNIKISSFKYITDQSDEKLFENLKENKLLADQKFADLLLKLQKGF